MLQELELSVIETNKTGMCAINTSNNNATLLEKHISFLADFFGDSCRPGPWTQNDNLDNILSILYGCLLFFF